MLYIVQLPIGRDNRRNLTVIHAESYVEVAETLGLPDGWQIWVSLTDSELRAIMDDKNNYVTKFLCRYRY